MIMIIGSVIRALELWAFILPFMVGGLVLAGLAIELKMFDRLLPVVKPMMRLAHFSPGSGLAFLVAFGSPIAAEAMIAEFHADKKIEERETVIASIATWFPLSIHESLVWFSPILIPMLGIIGIIYILLFVLSGMIVTIVMIFFGRILLTENNDDFIRDNKKVPFKTALKGSIKNSVSILKRIFTIAFPVSIAAFIVMDMGVFDVLPRYLGWIPLLPPESLGIIAVHFANEMAGYGMIAGFMDSGILDFKGVLLTLMVADVFVTFKYIFIFLLPYYCGLFGHKLGTRITAISTGLRLVLVVWMIFLIALYL